VVAAPATLSGRTLMVSPGYSRLTALRALQITRWRQSSVTVRLSPVPEFSVGFSPLNLVRRQSKSEKGNPINESQCQNQNPPVPKSSAYDNGFCNILTQKD
jgi:hypothetical protein